LNELGRNFSIERDEGCEERLRFLDRHTGPKTTDKSMGKSPVGQTYQEKYNSGDAPESEVPTTCSTKGQEEGWENKRAETGHTGGTVSAAIQDEKKE